jgi:hypothetical protein
MPANIFIPLQPKTRRPLFASRPRFQVAIYSEDGQERLPEIYRFRNAAQMVADIHNAENTKAVQARGGEWFERSYYRVVNAWPWQVRLRHWLRGKWEAYCEERRFWARERREDERDMW